MQAVHDHHATYPLIKKPTNRLLLTFSPDFALNSQIWLFYAEKWIFLKKLGTLLTATVYIVEQSPFATAQRLDTVNSNAVSANGIILRCIYAVVANNIRCKNLCSCFFMIRFTRDLNQRSLTLPVSNACLSGESDATVTPQDNYIIS